MVGKFYIVATPIGNLEDITFRALRTLKEVDAIFSEDTRVTRKLLAHYDIRKPLEAYHEHSRQRVFTRIFFLLDSGKSIAYVTCAGTPGISDPGPRLVDAILSRYGDGISIVPIPGPSAVAAIASLASTPMDEFHFFGYPPVKKGRRSFFRDVAENPFPGILFESPHRILRTLADLDRAVGENRKVVMGRELTKVFETVRRGVLGELRMALEKERPRGEYVLLLEAGENKRTALKKSAN